MVVNGTFHVETWHGAYGYCIGYRQAILWPVLLRYEDTDEWYSSDKDGFSDLFPYIRKLYDNATEVPFLELAYLIEEGKAGLLKHKMTQK